MHPNLQAEAVIDGEFARLKCETPAKIVSHPPSKFLVEKLAAPRARRALFVDEAKILRYRKPSGKPGSNDSETFREVEVGVSQLSSINCQKPWPSRKGAGSEELVKYMSSVPCYLQRTEKEENVQGKALNFGVIDFRRLEKWTSIQKMDQRNAVPSASYKAGPSSSFPKLSSGRSGTMSPVGRNQISSSVGHPDRSSKTVKTNMIEERSQIFSSPPISRTSSKGTLIKSNNENCNKCPHVLRTSMKAEEDCPSQGKKSKMYNLQTCDAAQLADGQLERNCMEVGVAVDHPQGDNRISTGNLTSQLVSKKTLDVQNSFSGKPSQRGSQNIIVPYNIPHQHPRPAVIQSEVTDMGTAALLIKSEAFTHQTIAKDARSGYNDKQPMHRIDNVVEHSSVQKVESISKGKYECSIKIPSEAGLKWLNRSSSLHEDSLSHQPKETNGSDNVDEKGRSNSRGRVSPLRRMLDPLFKPKHGGNSRSMASSPIDHAQKQCNDNMISNGNQSNSLNAMHKTSDAEVCSSCSLVSSCSTVLLQDDRYDARMRQALLKLAWKNGQPLFMFSTTDHSVLVGSVRRTGNLVKDDLVAVYTIFTAEESKKKGGVWIGQSRNKKSNLLYDVVGQLQVSCSKLSCCDSNKFVTSKEYVLVGDKVSSQACLDPCSNELAAIIVKAAYETVNDCFYEALCRDPDCDKFENRCSSFHANGLQIVQYPENSNTNTITAILPSGIHGFSDTGKPSSIIERWKSGGSCDCGGWDEGCWLSVLADRLQESKAAPAPVQECSITDENRRMELFIQGGKKENKHSFSMIAFKEGLYTVEFSPSISSLQAFAICIATLHSRIPIHSLSVNHENLRDYPYDGCPWMNNRHNNGVPTSYVEHHPPLSPVGRA
ncbi:hypothetical protein HPP92_019861 [Vanilla planifolia]|uniref:Uncharacterized protein n=1 Tax=Vanilla planifolia TaxID=51239 RepID=A0A835UJB5_VANPL|nr:hypothetical protein HPP92_019861 [Vanilla planifolia]